MSEVAKCLGRGTRLGTFGLVLLAACMVGVAGCDSASGVNASPVIMDPNAMGTAGTGVDGNTAGTGVPTAGTGVPGTAGTEATAGTGTGAAGTDAADGGVTHHGPYMNLAPAATTALVKGMGTTVTPAPPTGWDWYEIDNTFCRDGSKNGIYVRHTDSDKLLIYFEGGGACTTKGFCHFNPKNVNEILTGDGQSVLGSSLATVAGRQQPGVYSMGLAGIFDESKTENPYKGWNMVYIPYCTGDVHFGSNDAAMVPGVPEPQKLVGYKNTREFVSHLIPTFTDKVHELVVTGASAGSFGAALNMSMIADSFPGAKINAVLDSGVPFDDANWPKCMQKSWRELFKLNESLPPDCEDCFNEDGGGLLNLADFLIDKHPQGNIAIVSGIHDEVIRLFFAPGQNECATIKTADPFEITTSQLAGGMIFPAATYEAGLMGVRAKYESTGRLSTYYMSGANEVTHQHTFRARFYEAAAGGKTIAQFTTDFLAGTMSQVGP